MMYNMHSTLDPVYQQRASKELSNDSWHSAHYGSFIMLDIIGLRSQILEMTKSVYGCTGEK